MSKETHQPNSLCIQRVVLHAQTALALHAPLRLQLSGTQQPSRLHRTAVLQQKQCAEQRCSGASFQLRRAKVRARLKDAGRWSQTSVGAGTPAGPRVPLCRDGNVCSQRYSLSETPTHSLVQLKPAARCSAKQTSRAVLRCAGLRGRGVNATCPTSGRLREAATASAEGSISQQQ